jgi:hypothetical protein
MAWKYGWNRPKRGIIKSRFGVRGDEERDGRELIDLLKEFSKKPLLLL